MATSLDADLTLAHRLADASRSVSLSRFGGELRRWSKPDGSLVTDADEAVEDELREQLRIERPDDAVLGEERGQTGSGDRRWIIDGIDGTDSFAAGAPEWNTLIALEIDGRVVLSVCDQPPINRRYWAVRGCGAFCTHPPSIARKQVRVSSVGDLSRARSYVPPPERLLDEQARSIAQALASATNPEPPTNHFALQVATGGYEVAVVFLLDPWDLAGPSIVVEEAGGKFTDLEGRNELTSGAAIFTNGNVHDDVLQLISEVT